MSGEEIGTGKKFNMVQHVGSLFGQCITVDMIDPFHPEDPKQDIKIGGVNRGITERLKNASGSDPYTVQVLHLEQGSRLRPIPLSEIRPGSAKAR